MKVRFLEVNKFAIVNVRWRSISMYMQRFIEIQFFLQNEIIKNTIYFRYFHKKGLLSQIGQENLNVTAPHFNINGQSLIFLLQAFFARPRFLFPVRLIHFLQVRCFVRLFPFHFFNIEFIRSSWEKLLIFELDGSWLFKF